MGRIGPHSGARVAPFLLGATVVSQVLSIKVATYVASIPDWQIASQLNTPDATTYGTKVIDAQVSDARAILMTTGAWGKISMIASGNYNPLTDSTQALALRTLCVTVRDAHLNLSVFKMTDPATAASVKSMVDSLLSASIITQAVHDSLLALGTTPASWSDINNASSPVTPRDVGIARGAIA